MFVGFGHLLYSKARYYEGTCGLDLLYSNKATEQKQLS